LLNFYRALIKLRMQSPTLQTGAYEEIDPGNEEVLVFRRWDGSGSYIVALNFSDALQRAHLPDNPGMNIFCNIPNSVGWETGALPLLPYQGVIFSQERTVD